MGQTASTLELPRARASPHGCIPGDCLEPLWPIRQRSQDNGSRTCFNARTLRCPTPRPAALQAVLHLTRRLPDER